MTSMAVSWQTLSSQIPRDKPEHMTDDHEEKNLAKQFQDKS